MMHKIIQVSEVKIFHTVSPKKNPEQLELDPAYVLSLMWHLWKIMMCSIHRSSTTKPAQHVERQSVSVYDIHTKRKS